jgi:hypothetical protein
LAYLPDKQSLEALELKSETLWRSTVTNQDYKLCRNYQVENICNWAIIVSDPNNLCESCRLTKVIPNLGKPENKEAWFKLEQAKRRLLYTLKQLNCPIETEGSEDSLRFEFLSDEDVPLGEKVLTGHSQGLITLNIAEADDSEREKRRHQLGEPYRTLLGHFRHESGHYYWDKLIKDSRQLEDFRTCFGDERINYDQALKQHYEQVSVQDWQASFISHYASSHPWEDWAETWAHYLHMRDTLQTARASGFIFSSAINSKADSAFDTLSAQWFELSYLLNNLNRSLGLQDAYPFVLSKKVLAKLEFVHAILEPDSDLKKDVR